MNIKFPYRFDSSGQTATSNINDHIRELIDQLIFTMPGERVNRPTFGSNLHQLVFEPNSSELAATTQFTVQAALQQWLGEIIEVNEVRVQHRDSSLIVTIVYTIRRNRDKITSEFINQIN
jgi:phage baseplate assembly protein W